MIRQLALPFPHRPDFEHAPFLRADSNAAALAWLERGAWPQGRLLLWGQAGCGKTHLLHHWARRSAAQILSGPQLRLEPPLGPCAVDDPDLAPERVLLHLLNASADAGWQVLMTARRPPARWRFEIADLASRLRAVTAVEIGAACDPLLRMLLARLLADRQLAVAEAVQEHLLRHLPRTPAALREAATRLDRLALAHGGRVTRALAAQVVADMDMAAASPDVEAVGFPDGGDGSASPNRDALV